MFIWFVILIGTPWATWSKAVVEFRALICSGIYDDVIKWKQFPRNWPFVRGIHRSPVNSPHKGQWREALMFSLICVWINGWENNREVGDLRSYRAHYDVIVMEMHLWDVIIRPSSNSNGGLPIPSLKFKHGWMIEYQSHSMMVLMICVISFGSSLRIYTVFQGAICDVCNIQSLSEQLTLMPSLKVIANDGVGVRHLDIPPIRKSGIKVSNTPDVLSATTADMAMTLLLASARDLVQGQYYDDVVIHFPPHWPFIKESTVHSWVSLTKSQ